MIYHLHRTDPYFGVIEWLFGATRDGLKQSIFSVVTELELLVRPIREDDVWEMRQVRVVLDGPGVQVVGLDRQIARLAAEIRARLALSLADAAIVATALHTGCDAIVGNDERCARRVKEIPYVLLDDLVKEALT